MFYGSRIFGRLHVLSDLPKIFVIKASSFSSRISHAYCNEKAIVLQIKFLK